ncbi:MAG: DNA damage-inducible protein D, partial [Bacilli bacterium]
DPNKEVIALGQTYFAIQTRKQELTEEEYSKLNENERRLYIRKKTKNKNLKLYQAAMNADVKNFDKFTNCGYKGLYNGETADDIFKRKGLRYREDILDNMGSDELSYNEFRITLTEQKLVNEKIKGESKANDVHFEVGKAVRDTIERVGGIMPEQLPTPKKSIKELEKQNKKIVNK